MPKTKTPEVTECAGLIVFEACYVEGPNSRYAAAADKQLTKKVMSSADAVAVLQGPPTNRLTTSTSTAPSTGRNGTSSTRGGAGSPSAKSPGTIGARSSGPPTSRTRRRGSTRQ